MSAPELQPHAYVLAVNDLAAAADYFIAALGFATEWTDNGHWQSLHRGNVRIMLGSCVDALPPARLGDHAYFGFFVTSDIDALHAEFKSSGALILAPPSDKPWGWREMPIATPEGHRMMFAQRIS